MVIEKFEFLDVDDSHDYVSAEIQPEGCGIAIHPVGTGTFCGEQYGPIFLEFRKGVPFLIVWADIEKEDPTHVIDLSGTMWKNALDKVT